MTERELATKIRQSDLNLTTAKSAMESGMALKKALKIVMPPRDVSDGTCFRGAFNWTVHGVEAGVFDEHSIFRAVPEFALEASQPGARNFAGVFMLIPKKEVKNEPKRAGNN